MAIKLSRHAFVRFMDLHAWAGVVASSLLYLMVLTGSISLFHDQIATWQEPLSQVSSVESVTLDEALEVGLQGEIPTGRAFFRIPSHGYGSPRLNFKVEGADERTNVWIDAKNRRRVPIREALAHFLLDIHYLWHDLTGTVLFRVAGFLALTWLLLVTTGVLIHIKDIVRQFYQFRPAKSAKVFWSDLHKVLSVMGLPFQLMYSYTGAFIALSGLLISGLASPVFDNDKAHSRLVSSGASIERGRAADTVAAQPVVERSLQSLILAAQLAEPGLIKPDRLTLTGRGTKGSRVSVSGALDGTAPTAQGKVTLSAIDGTVLQVENTRTKTSKQTLNTWVHGLHYGLFGGITLKFLYFLLGLATCGTIVSGNWVWLTRREARRVAAGRAGAPLLARLTAGVGAGSLVAVGAIFLASRVIPLDVQGRKGAEELVFLGALSVCIVWGLLAQNTRKVWWQQVALAGGLLLPVVPLATRWSQAGVLGRGERLAAVVGVDVAVVCAGTLLCGCAWALRRAERQRSAGGTAAAKVPSLVAFAAPAEQRVRGEHA